MPLLGPLGNIFCLLFLKDYEKRHSLSHTQTSQANKKKKKSKIFQTGQKHRDISETSERKKYFFPFQLTLSELLHTWSPTVGCKHFHFLCVCMCVCMWKIKNTVHFYAKWKWDSDLLSKHQTFYLSSSISHFMSPSLNIAFDIILEKVVHLFLCYSNIFTSKKAVD